jgi:Bacterial protein of unknown function (DUF916)
MARTRFAERVCALIVVVAGVTVLSPRDAGAAQGTDVVSGSVAPGSQTDPAGSFYQLLLAPGASVEQSVVITNQNAKAVLVDISGVDATTGASTGASYGSPGSKPRSIGAWISVEQRQIQLAPGERRTIAFRIDVPRDATAGQHLAGLSIAVPKSDAPRAAKPGTNQAAFEVSLQAQRVIAVEVDIAGPRAPELVVSGARPVAHGDSIDIELAIENRGNAFARGRGVLAVPDTGLRSEFPIDTFVSRTSIKMLIPWTRSARSGDHKVEVVLNYDDGRRAKWSGVLSIDEALRAELDGQLPVAQENDRGADDALKLDALTVGGGAAGVAACGAFAVRLRRRRSLRVNGVRVRD